MGQEVGVGPLDEVVGYVLKQAASALRTGMEAALRPLELSVAQYACLELLGQRPGLSNAELARGAFVTRQSMNLVLRGLADRGLVTRFPTGPHGRVRPTDLTDTGRRRLSAASSAVRGVEQQMLSPLTDSQQRRLRADLAACTAALSAVTPDQAGTDNHEADSPVPPIP